MRERNKKGREIRKDRVNVKIDEGKKSKTKKRKNKSVEM